MKMIKWERKKLKLKLNFHSKKKEDTNETFIEYLKRSKTRIMWGKERLADEEKQMLAQFGVVKSFESRRRNPVCCLIHTAERKCRVFFIELIIAANKMETSSLTRHLWHLMILVLWTINWIDLQSKCCTAKPKENTFAHFFLMKMKSPQQTISSLPLSPSLPIWLVFVQYYVYVWHNIHVFASILMN